MSDAHPSDKPIVINVDYLLIAGVKDSSVEKANAHVR
jgi:hypothetical protein